MKSRLLLVPLALLAAAPVAAAETRIAEQKYITLAARIVATVDACTALNVIDPGLGFLDEIEVGMLELGASQEETEEWFSNVAATKSPAIQVILKSEDTDAVWLQCTKDIDDKRRELAAILREDETIPPEDTPGPLPAQAD
ncbi:hypothetical protein G6L37_07390 [Agrobacterium rubi]|nr:hypothetical protein [Agrobacterium rubi]NTF25191.1 hypothetical protein [Agrobacterium rubi]